MTDYAPGTTITTTTYDVASTAQNTDPVNVSLYGKTIPQLFGATKVLCAPVWATAPVDTGDDTGDRTITVFYMVGLRAPLTVNVKVHQIWIDNILKYNADDGTPPLIDFTFYDGNDGQAAPPEIVADQGADNTPGFRGRMGVILRNYRIPVGNAFPEMTVLVEQIAESNERFVTPFLLRPNEPIAGGFSSEIGLLLSLATDTMIVVDGYAQRLLNFSPTTGALTSNPIMAKFAGYDSGVTGHSKGALTPAGNLFTFFYSSAGYGQLREYDVLTGDIVASYGTQLEFAETFDTAPGAAGVADYWAMVASQFGSMQIYKRGANGGPLELAQSWDTTHTGFSLIDYGVSIKLVDLTSISPDNKLAFGFATNSKRINQLTYVNGGGDTTADLVTPFDITFATGTQYGNDVLGPGNGVFNNVPVNNGVAQTVGKGTYFYGYKAPYVTPQSPPYDASKMDYSKPIGYHNVVKKVSIKAVTSCFEVFDLAKYPADNAAQEAILGFWVSANGGNCTVVTRVNYANGDSAIRLIFCRTIISSVTTGRVNNDGGNAGNGYLGLPSPLTDAGGAQYQSNSQFLVDAQAYIHDGVIDHYKLMQIPAGQSSLVYQKAGATTDFAIVDLATGAVSYYDAGTYINTVTGVTYTDTGGGMGAAYSIYDSSTYRAYYTSGALPDYPGIIALGGSDPKHANLPLSTYLTSIAMLAGYDEADVSCNTAVSSVSIVGSVINTQTDFLTLLSQVTTAFSIDVVETEGKLKFNGPLRGASFSFARTLTDDDLAPPDQFSQDDGALLNKTRTVASELPTVFEIDYLDSDNDFQVGAQQGKRTQYPARTSAGISPVTVSVPIAMQAATALYWAEFSLFEIWAGALVIEGLLSREQLDLEPGDYIEIATESDGTYVAKINTITINNDWSMSLTAVSVAQEAPASDSVNDPSTTVVASPPATAGKYNVALVENISLVPYSAYATSIPAGMSIITAVSDIPVDVFLFHADNTYTELSTGGGALFGVIVNDHPAQLNFEAPDDITPIKFTLSNVMTGVVSGDASAYLSGSNSALIGATGRWELIYFRDFTFDGTYFVLGHVTRGRRGSDAFMAQQQAGDTIVILPPDAGIALMTMEADIALPYSVAAKTMAINGAQVFKTTPIVVTGGTLKPWSPVDVRASRSVNDVVLTWQRRDRNETDLTDDTDDIPLSETTEAYDLEILDGFGNVVRAVPGLTASTYTYTAEQINDDNIDTSSSITVQIYQLSSVVGRGYVRKATCQLI